MTTFDMIRRGADALVKHMRFDPTDDVDVAEARNLVSVVLDAALPVDRSDLSVDQSTPFRLSPAGTLAARVTPGWRVLYAADPPRHHFGQELTDQHVAAWSPLVRKGPSNVG